LTFTNLNFFEENIKEWKIWKPYSTSPVLYLLLGTIHVTFGNIFTNQSLTDVSYYSHTNDLKMTNPYLYLYSRNILIDH
jgi:hypothetical protein